MNHLNFRNSILMLAPVLLLGACGKPTDAAQGAAVVPESKAPAEVVAPAPVASPEAAAAGAAGLREYRDPVTGQPREPTAAELKALAAAAQSASKASNGARRKNKEIVLPDGAVAVEENTMSEMKGCMQKDGRIVVDHDCKGAAPANVSKP